MASPHTAPAAWHATSTPHWPRAALAHAAKAWCAIAVAGQLAFAAYIVALYGGAAVRGDFAAWNSIMRHGYVEGAVAGNTATVLHLVGAVLMMLGGALQLLPSVRARHPALHRWTGRAYLLAAVGASVSGIYMVWWRGTVGDAVQHAGTTLNGVLVLGFAAMALWRIRQRDIDAHRRWAWRLYLAVNGVWFFRISFMFWVGIHRGPAGFDPSTFVGPFLSIMAYAQYLLPLAILELYLLCRARGGAMAHLGMALLLAAAALVTGAGVALASVGMWWPIVAA